MILIANDQTPEVVQPSEEPLDFPSSTVSSQGPPVLGSVSAVGAVRGNEFGPLLTQALVQRIGVIGAVADQSWGLFLEETLLERAFDEGDLMRRSTGNANGDRKTMAVGHSHDLGPFPTPSGTDSGAPFFAPLKVASMKASETSILPRSRRSSASTCRMRVSVPSRTQPWKRRWQVWYGGYRSGKSFQGAPVRKIQRTPFNTSRLPRQGRPRPSARRFSRSNGSSKAHWTSVISMPSFRCNPLWPQHLSPFVYHLGHL